MSLEVPSYEPSLPPAVAGPGFLQDGTEVWVRPVQAADRDLLSKFADSVSLASIEPRYFPAIRSAVAHKEVAAPSPLAERLCLLVLGERGGDVTALGVGEYARSAAGSSLAEVALLVADPYRGLGIASLLLARLARAAQAHGIRRFVARVRAENPEMLEVFRAGGLPFTEERLEDEVDVVFPIVPPGERRPASRPGAAGSHGRRRAPRHATA